MQSFWDKKCDAIRKHLEEHLGGTLWEPFVNLVENPSLGTWWEHKWEQQQNPTPTTTTTTQKPLTKRKKKTFPHWP
jgi:hypothetical protein